MTNLTNDVSQIHMQEFFNAADLANSLQTLTLFGFGGTLEAAEQNLAVAMMAENYLVQPIHFAADKLGLKIDKIVRTSQHKVTEAPIHTPAMVIEPGTIGLVSYRWTAYVDDKPFYITEVFWYVGEAIRPAVATADDFWTVTIEGRPSLRVTIESKASIAKNQKLFDGDPTPPGYYLTVVTMLQSVPQVEAAPPGIFIPELPPAHWKPDMRD
jgi:4-hydroxy-tetrahydrodipicolinate reductase